MRESSNYPMGAEHDPSAPWNERTPDPIERQCYIECFIRCSKPVTTENYVVYETSERYNDIYEREEDTTCTEWWREWEEQYYEPQDAMEKLCDLVEQYVPKDKWAYHDVKKLIASARGWQMHDRPEVDEQ